MRNKYFLNNNLSSDDDYDHYYYDDDDFVVYDDDDDDDDADDYYSTQLDTQQNQSEVHTILINQNIPNMSCAKICYIWIMRFFSFCFQLLQPFQRRPLLRQVRIPYIPY